MDELINSARDSLGGYCYNECNSYCCKKGTLNVKKSDVDRCQVLKEHFIKIGLNESNKFSLVLPCPALQNNLCSTYETRPQICRDFPIFVDHERKIITFSNKCPAVLENKFYPFIRQINALGYKVED